MSTLPAENQAFKVKAEVRYTVDIGVFTAPSAQLAIDLATASAVYRQKFGQHKGGFYDLEARPLETGHNPLCGCGWCK